MCEYEVDPLPCPYCHGSGEIWLDDITNEECQYCCGEGWID